MTEAVGPDSQARPYIGLKFGPIRIEAHAAIYATIMVMTSFALIDEGTDPLRRGPWAELIAVTIAPLFALAAAHAFSDALDLQITEGHRLSRADRRHILLRNAQFMYVAIPPIVLLLIFLLIDMPADQAVAWIMLAGLISLFGWGVFAGKKAGLGPVRRLSFGVGYGLMGLIVLMIELILAH